MLFTKYKRCICGHTKNTHTDDCGSKNNEAGDQKSSMYCRAAYCGCGEYTAQEKKLKEPKHANYKGR